MKSEKRRRIVVVSIVCILILAAVSAQPVCLIEPQESASLWAHDNMFAWGVSVDSKSRTLEERAPMLERLGFKQLGVGWEAKDVATFDEQVETLKRHGLKIIAWTVYDVDDPTAAVDWKRYKIQDLAVLSGQREPAKDAMSVGEMLEMFKRHDISPQLWLIRRMRSSKPTPEPTKPMSEWTDEEKNQGFRQLLGYDLTATAQEKALRVRQEAHHIKPLAQLAAAYGIKVGLYKHGGWIGMADNQIAVIERLKTLGVTNVGIIYQFIHAHDEVDDTTNFPATWEKMQPYVLAVNITGMHAGRTTIYPILYPSQGDLEIRMMKTIQDSGWKGPIGLSPEKGGDAEINLRNNIIGLDWLAAELKQPGSGGRRPFPSAR